MTLSINDYDPEKGFSDEWKTVSFTDEAIVDLEWNQSSGLIFVTTESGVVWVSSDKGETWLLQSEILEKLGTRYETMLEDIEEDHSRKLEDTELYYLREKKKILNDKT